jgi:hypothetical protein
VPGFVLIPNVVTSTDQLRGMRSRTWIYAGEEIPLQRVGEGSCHTPEPGNDRW